MKNLIVFSIDDNYIEPFVVAIKSFSLRHDVNRYAIGLIYNKISKKNINIIKKFLSSINLEIQLKKIEDIFTKYETGYHFNSVIFYRLLIPTLFPQYNKSIYLDSDMIFLGNIDYLYELDLDGYVVGAVGRIDKSKVPKHMMQYTNSYFASGLLLLNHHEFINKKIYEKSIYFLDNFNYEMPDQDALNYAISDEWIYWLPYEYGVLTHEDVFSNTQLDKAKILQFCGRQKPWQYGNSHSCKDIYLDMWSKTPLYNRKFIILDKTVSILKILKKRLNLIMLKLAKIFGLLSSPSLSKILLSLKFNGYLLDTGWVESFIKQMPVSSDGCPLPWITLPCLDFIVERLKKDFNVFEFGAGNSTNFFSGYVKTVVSIEHEKEWFERIYREAPNNVCINYCPLIYDDDYCRFALKIDAKFELIVVDGRDRVNCIKNSIECLTKNGCIILDDSERENYQEGINYLLKNNFKRIDFWGVALGLTYKKCTTIFYREDNCFGI